jgi:hypothetical protein
VGLDVLVEGDPKMFNPYGVIAVNPARYRDVNFKAAMQFIEWLTGPEGRRAIADFKGERRAALLSGAQVMRGMCAAVFALARRFRARPTSCASAPRTRSRIPASCRCSRRPSRARRRDRRAPLVAGTGQVMKYAANGDVDIVSSPTAARTRKALVARGIGGRAPTSCGTTS